MFEPILHQLSSSLLKRHINRCLALPGGRSRPDKVFSCIRFLLDTYGVSGKTILDLGCGRGSYGYLLRRVYGNSIRIIGVELNRDYLKPPTFLRTNYDQIIVDDIRKVDIHSISFHIALVCDVLEHLEKSDAIQFTKKLLDQRVLVIASIPVAKKHWHQATEFEQMNPLERHQHNWDVLEAQQSLSLRLVARFDAIGVFSNIEILLGLDN